MADASPVRFATIGSNFITDAFLKASKEVPGFELAAVRTEGEAVLEVVFAKPNRSHAFECTGVGRYTAELRNERRRTHISMVPPAHSRLSKSLPNAKVLMLST